MYSENTLTTLKNLLFPESLGRFNQTWHKTSLDVGPRLKFLQWS